jgi:hypothetical protein
MECDKKITVTCTANIAGIGPVQFEFPVKDAPCLNDVCEKVPYKEALWVSILQEGVVPKFVLIKPEWPDRKKYKFKGDIFYHTSDEVEYEGKPLQAPHVFYGGMAGWITDEDLTGLYFWSEIEGVDPDPEKPEDKGLTKFDHLAKPIPVHIYVGYCNSCPEDEDEEEDERSPVGTQSPQGRTGVRGTEDASQTFETSGSLETSTGEGT